LKIISGKFKGKILPFDKNLPSKPTKNIAKEALFNYLSQEFRWEDVVMLDCFAGTGNVGLEALSRGARWVYFVDNSKKCQVFVQKILKEWKIYNANFILTDCFTFVNQNQMVFDIIFLDPPYQKIPLHLLIPKLRNFLKSNGKLVLEHLYTDSFQNFDGYLEKKVYGLSAFSVFK